MSRKYSLWLMPEGAERERLYTVIRTLAAQLDTPVFEPHVTLYGGLHTDTLSAVLAQCAELAHGTAALPLHPEGIEMQQEYFHSAYIALHTSPALSALFRRAVAVFGEERGFRPHLSLLYGTTSRDRKEQALRDILPHGEPTSPCTARTLALYDTTGDVADWCEAGRWELRA